MNKTAIIAALLIANSALAFPPMRVLSGPAASAITIKLTPAPIPTPTPSSTPSPDPE